MDRGVPVDQRPKFMFERAKKQLQITVDNVIEAGQIESLRLLLNDYRKFFYLEQFKETCNKVLKMKEGPLNTSMKVTVIESLAF